MRLSWRGWLQKSGDEISPWAGLIFGALYLGAVMAVGVAAIYVQRAELTRQHLADMQQWTYWVSQHISRVAPEGPVAVGHELRRAAREEGILFCAVVSSSGVFTAHSDPTRAGQIAPDLEWQDSDQPRVRIGAGLEPAGSWVMASRLAAGGGEAKEVKAETLWVGVAPVHFAWKQSDMVFWVGYVLLGVLGLYLMAYRLLRRAVQPLAVIRRRLLGCENEFEQSLVALRLNDSYDEISASWNKLIQFVSEMQEQLRRSRLVTDVTAAMDGYRSERLTSILMQIPFGVLVVDAEGNVSFANRSASGMLGDSGDPLEGTAASKLFEEDLRLSLLSPASSGRGSSASLSRWTDHRFERPHGDVTLRFWSIMSDTSDNEYILFVQDITQAKEAERARDQFLYHVTHELRTPLTNIRAYAETLSHGVIEDEQTIRECYNVIMGETQRLNRLVEDILNVSQLEVGTARLDLGEVQFERLMRSVVQDTQGSADAKNIDLVLHLPVKMPQLRGDKERLSVVLTNLIGNAIKYTPQGGRVDVRCACESGRVRITVTDTGIGIRREDQEKIFEKFYRVNDEQVSAIPGTGLGLAIVKETVRLHGGSVFVESTPGHGSTFTVTLPAVVMEEGTAGSGAGTRQLAVAGAGREK